MKFTPGPWFVSRDDRDGYEWNNHIASVATPHIEICAMFHTNREDGNATGEANAQLVAAAPHLFKACMAAKDFLIHDLEEPGRTVFWKLIEALKKSGWTAPTTSENSEKQP
jgi:hypothetical protein